MIEIQSLVKKYQHVTALAGIDLAILPGQLFGLIGANGAGKTTALKIIATLLRPSSGRVCVLGKDVCTDALAVRKMIGYVPENGTVYEGLSAMEYLRLAGRLHGLSDELIARRSARLLDQFKLGEERHELMRQYSRGMRQKVLISSALLHEPAVLLLDEPMDGLDVRTQFTLKGILQDWKRQGKIAVYSSHQMEIVESLCDSIAIIDRGRIAASGAPEVLLNAAGTRSLAEAFLHFTSSRNNEFSSPC
ncbi:MAG: ABC transporter ATP-binding protein [Acidobacteria bacterium]|nr:ABC transporter ATP-binding protein [Acidobacteriota bacterium]